MSRLPMPATLSVVLLLLGAGMQIRRMRGDRLSLPKVISETFGALRANAVRFTLLALAACLPAVIAVYLGEPWRTGFLHSGPTDLELIPLRLYVPAVIMLPGLFAAGVMAHLRGEVLARRPNFRRGLAAVAHGLTFTFFVGMLGPVTAVVGYLLGMLAFNVLILVLPAEVAFTLALAAALAPGLYLATRLFVALPVAVLKRTGILQGLDESGGLTRGNSSSIGLLLIAALCLLTLGSTLLGHVLPPGHLRYIGHLMLAFVLMIPLSAATTVVYARLVGEPGNVSAADLAQTFE